MGGGTIFCEERVGVMRRVDLDDDLKTFEETMQPVALSNVIFNMR